jgi:hypothetical protein
LDVVARVSLPSCPIPGGYTRAGPGFSWSGAEG